MYSAITGSHQLGANSALLQDVANQNIPGIILIALHLFRPFYKKQF